MPLKTNWTKPTSKWYKIIGSHPPDEKGIPENLKLFKLTLNKTALAKN